MANYLYLNAKLKERLSKRISHHELIQLANAPNFNIALKLLEDGYYASYAKTYRKEGSFAKAELALLQEEINLFKDLQPALASYLVKALLTGFEVDNLKMVINLWFSQMVFKKPLNGKTLFLEDLILWPIPYNQLLSAGSLASFSQLLSYTPYGQIIMETANKNSYQINLELDRFFFSKLLLAINQLTGTGRLAAGRFLSSWLDFENLINAVKLRTSTVLILEELYLEGGNLTLDNLKELSAYDIKIINYLKVNYHLNNPQLEYNIVSFIEAAKTSVLKEQAINMLADKKANVTSVMAYYWLVLAEFKEIKTILQHHYYQS
ncbi:MAG: V-type ATPase subunit [Spirochaetaceae bacterium]|nr:V-type ATPase subunit [Spirochaetaceae bacterium]